MAVRAKRYSNGPKPSHDTSKEMKENSLRLHDTASEKTGHESNDRTLKSDKGSEQEEELLDDNDGLKIEDVTNSGYSSGNRLNVVETSSLFNNEMPGNTNTVVSHQVASSNPSTRYHHDHNENNTTDSNATANLHHRQESPQRPFSSSSPSPSPEYKASKMPVAPRGPPTPPLEPSSNEINVLESSHKQYSHHVTTTPPNESTPTPSSSPSLSLLSSAPTPLSTSEEPTDAAPELRNIIESQFSLEILLKHRELNLIEDEIAKIHVMMLQMKQYSNHPNATSCHDPHDFVHTYAQYLQPPSYNGDRTSGTNALGKTDLVEEETLSAIGRPQRASALRSHTRLMHANLQCIYRRNDGILVKLICPDCSRGNFGSVQGFINHCRISHSREFGSHDSAAMACGQELEHQDEIGLQAKESASTEESKLKLQQLQVPQLKAQVKQHSEVMNVSITAPVPVQAVPSTINLLQLLKKRKMDDIDLDELVRTSLQKIDKSHLFEDEENDEEPEQTLGEEATPFERVLAEARRLGLNVDEMNKASPSISSLNGSNSSNSSSNSKRGRGRGGSFRGKPRAKISESGESVETVRPSNFALRRMPSKASPSKTRSKTRNEVIEVEDSVMETFSEPHATIESSINTSSTNSPPSPPRVYSPSPSESSLKDNVIGNLAKYIPISRFF